MGMSHKRANAPHFTYKKIVVSLVLLAIAACSSSQLNARPLYAAIAMDGNTGKTVYARSADSYRFPASLTKVMTLYVLFQEMKAGRIKKHTRLHVSRFAASKPPSKLGLRPGSSISAHNAIMALTTKSANDVATVIAEKISGSETAFARRMTVTARSLGMSRTTFKNASGLPHRAQRTTARDLARLAIAIQRDFPDKYHYFRVRSFRYGKRTYRTHNRLLGRFSGTDGIKTGYTRASGFNLMTSVRRGKKHVIAIVLGGRTGRERNSKMKRLVSRALPRVSTYRPKKRRKKIKITTGKPHPLPRPVSAPRHKAVKLAALPKQQAHITAHDSHNAAKPAPLVPLAHKPPRAKKQNLTVVASARPMVLDQLPPLKPSMIQPASSTGNNTVKTLVRHERLSTIALKTRFSTKPTVVTTVPDTPSPVLANLSLRSEISPTHQIPANAHQNKWSVQIGAYARKNDARQSLQNALLVTRGKLTNSDAYTMTYAKHDKVIYRARFLGLTKTAALQICRVLKRRSINCFPLAP